MPTLADLLRSAGPDFAQKDRDQFLGDVFEGLAALHAAGLSCGHLDPTEIDLDRFARTRGAVARLRFWGEGADEPDAADRRAADLRLAAGLVRTLAAAPDGGRPTRLGTSLLAFADSLQSGALATAAEAKTAYGALLGAHGAAHRPHRDPDGDPAHRRPVRPLPDPEPEDDGRAAPSAAVRRRAAARRAPTGLALVSAGSEAARQTVQFVRVLLILAGIAAVGVAAVLGLRWHDERMRRLHAIATPDAYNAVSIVPLSRTEAAGGQPGLEGLFDLPPDLLAAEAEAGNALAVARLELENVLAATNADAVALASARLAPLLPALRSAATNDLPAAYLAGYAALLGLGAPRDPAAAFRALDEAAARGSARSALLLGDWFASDAPLPPPHETDGRLARDREALARYRAAGGADAAPTPLWRPAADRIAAVLRRATAATDFADDYGAWLRAAAAAGHIPSMAVLAEPGPFAPANPADSLEWLRRINNFPGALPWVRAWAQVRMAATFAEGRGVPRSDSSARLWYERAAQAGNRSAMLALADFCESGRGRSDGRADDDAAAEWRAKAADAGPEPTFDPPLLPVSL